MAIKATKPLPGARSSFWSWEVSSVLAGFAFTLASLIGGPFYLAPASARVSELRTEIAAQRGRIAMTDAALFFNQLAFGLGAFVFSIRPDHVDDSEVATALHHRALASQRQNSRVFLSELGLAKRIDFAKASAGHAALVEAETRNFTLDTYRATNAFEFSLAMQALRENGADQLGLPAHGQALVAARLDYDFRVLITSLAAAFGALFLLVATLAASLPRASKKRTEATAATLLALALDQARLRLNQAGTPSPPAPRSS